jgi:hypothetical protein
MPRVLLHGNPEVPVIWDDLVGALAERGERDIVRLAPPGFGAPVPPGWEASAAGYRRWLVGELTDLGGEVDLVAHDWGAGHLWALLDGDAHLLRSWAADCAGLIHPDYHWHDAAVAWQTPGVGEELVAAMVATPVADTAAGLADAGMGPRAAAAVAEALDAEMGSCILSLYRSAAQPYLADLGARLAERPPPVPGLVIVATEDPFAGTAAMATEVAGWLGAATCTLPGRGHWWMGGDPGDVADALVAHWAAVD